MASDQEIEAAAAEALKKILDGRAQSFREGEDQAELIDPEKLQRIQAEAAARQRRKSRAPILRRVFQ